LRVIDNVEKVLAIELLSAAQALEFRRPLKTAPVLESVVSDFRNKVSFNQEDRVFYNDMITAIKFVQSYNLHAN
jgi:histidine ammonia-lyase